MHNCWTVLCQDSFNQLQCYLFEGITLFIGVVSCILVCHRFISCSLQRWVLLRPHRMVKVLFQRQSYPVCHPMFSSERFCPSCEASKVDGLYCKRIWRNLWPWHIDTVKPYLHRQTVIMTDPIRSSIDRWSAVRRLKRWKGWSEQSMTNARPLNRTLLRLSQEDPPTTLSIVCIPMNVKPLHWSEPRSGWHCGSNRATSRWMIWPCFLWMFGWHGLKLTCSHEQWYSLTKLINQSVDNLAIDNSIKLPLFLLW